MNDINNKGFFKSRSIFKKISLGAIYLLVASLPLIVFPWTTERLEINKQSVMLVLVSLAVVFWLVQMIVNKNFLLKKSWLYVLTALILISVLFSAVFSIAPFTSWVGLNKQEYVSFLSTLSFILMFFIGGEMFADRKVQRNIWSLSLISSAIVGLMTIFSQFGFIVINSTLIGSPNSLGMYLGTMSVLGVSIWLASSKETIDVLPKKTWGVLVKISILITVLAGLLTMLALDFWAIWVALLIGLLFIFVFSIIKVEDFKNTGRFVLPMILFVVAVLFLFLPSFYKGKFPTEVTLSYKTSWNVAKDSLKEHSLFLGSGPGTYMMDYVKNVPQEINATKLWDTQFDRSASFYLTILPTYGVIATGLIFLFILLMIILSVKALVKSQINDDWKFIFISFSAWLVLVAGQFLYASNITLLFLFWLLSAMIFSQLNPRVKSISFTTSPRLGLLTTFVFVLVGVGLTTVIFVTISRYTAEISFANAVSKNSSGAELDEVIKDIDTAARLNRLNDEFYRNLGNALLLKTPELLEDPNIDPKVVQGTILASIGSAQRAIKLSPSNVNNWSLAGDLYREVAPVWNDADIQSIEAFKQASELSPVNPKYLVSLGRSYIVLADSLNKMSQSDDEEVASQKKLERDNVLVSAVDSLTKAIELKENYAPAYFYLAAAYERQGNVADAILKMEALKGAYPLDVGVSFQLGLLYLRQGKNDLAQEELERTLSLSPNYSNARWFLSVVYEQNKEIDKAIEQLQKIKEINPENSELVDQRLDRLKQGKINKNIPGPLDEVNIPEEATDSVIDGNVVSETASTVTNEVVNNP